jgi:hypothetical protein
MACFNRSEEKNEFFPSFNGLTRRGEFPVRSLVTGRAKPLSDVPDKILGYTVLARRCFRCRSLRWSSRVATLKLSRESKRSAAYHNSCVPYSG